MVWGLAASPPLIIDVTRPSLRARIAENCINAEAKKKMVLRPQRTWHSTPPWQALFKAEFVCPQRSTVRPSF